MLLAFALALGMSAAVPTTDENALVAIDRAHRALNARVAPSVVVVISISANGDKSFGSGFFVSSRGAVLTNAHVVGENKDVSIVTLNACELHGRVVERGDGADVALIEVDLSRDPKCVESIVPLTIVPVPPDVVGSDVAAIGHGAGGIWTFTLGTITNLYHGQGAYNHAYLLQTQTPVNPGNSGGPLVDVQGHVLGIITAGLTQTQAVNFAIPASWAASRLKQFAGLVEKR